MRCCYIIIVIIKFLIGKKSTRALRLRKSLEHLGPIFVKLGQMLSTRTDLLPEDIIQELGCLQDSVAPFKSSIAVQTVEQQFRAPISAIFKEFDVEPMAAASIAQVHRAILLTGEKVIVKILRPKIKQQAKRDINLLSNIVMFIAILWPPFRKLKLKQLVIEFYKTIHDELDLTREAANGSLLRHNSSKLAPFLYIPQIYWQYTTEKVLVMEYISGIAIANTTELNKHNVNLTYLAEIVIKIFFTQAFQDCFFHADLHPGNILVDITNRQIPKLVLVDFGITGSLNKRDQEYLAQNFMALFQRDYNKLAELHVHSGWLPADANVNDFAASMRFVCEPMFAQALVERSIGKTLAQLLATAAKFKINIQPQLILLQKTLLSIEGLVRLLDPQLDLWQTASPVLEDWMRQQSSVKVLLNRAINGIKELLP
ncbi:MAG: ubiquinone biosynthesis regulatory protein kinase UbiB [Legionellales bacterium]|nr:MAG: ubiquinone biosynthesis regulatory protein kinase UbiB [Legionellales bacterium]